MADTLIVVDDVTGKVTKRVPVESLPHKTYKKADGTDYVNGDTIGSGIVSANRGATPPGVGELPINDIGETWTGTGWKAGATPTIDATSKHWLIDNVDTGVVAEGQDGATPTVDPVSKTWIVGGVDTGIIAEGQDGADGADGADGGGLSTVATNSPVTGTGVDAANALGLDCAATAACLKGEFYFGFSDSTAGAPDNSDTTKEPLILPFDPAAGKYWDGTAWVDLPGGGGGSGTISNPASDPPDITGTSCVTVPEAGLYRIEWDYTAYNPSIVNGNTAPENVTPMSPYGIGDVHYQGNAQGGVITTVFGSNVPSQICPGNAIGSSSVNAPFKAWKIG